MYELVNYCFAHTFFVCAKEILCVAIYFQLKITVSDKKLCEVKCLGLRVGLDNALLGQENFRQTISNRLSDESPWVRQVRDKKVTSPLERQITSQRV